MFALTALAVVAVVIAPHISRYFLFFSLIFGFFLFISWLWLVGGGNKC